MIVWLKKIFHQTPWYLPPVFWIPVIIYLTYNESQIVSLSSKVSHSASFVKSWWFIMKMISTERHQQHFNSLSHRCFLVDTRRVHAASIFISYECCESSHVVDISFPSSWTSSQSKFVNSMSHFFKPFYYDFKQFITYLISRTINIY